MSIPSLLNVLVKFSNERLTHKQKRIIIYLKTNSVNTNVTKLVPKLTKELNCCSSTVWNNLNSLKRAGLINYGSTQDRGRHITITQIGKLLKIRVGSLMGKRATEDRESEGSTPSQPIMYLKSRGHNIK